MPKISKEQQEGIDAMAIAILDSKILMGGAEDHIRAVNALKDLAESHLIKEKIMDLVPDAGDEVNHPAHYTSHPSGIECIEIVEHLPFNQGNAIKYVWRVGDKGKPIQDLQKAIWYLTREIDRMKRQGETQ